ncbi:uncharacterized protein LOC132743463 [Ruditapes philippinarum]|uniref:uncharacterized protein LOC132743463 n=1 Tax=Ruditapes philippinarum TaxID=129788 RepID=UPI00295C0D1D|nr:uncharacterized protein LOC132743463 [Ruditapes philippinarum]
MYEISLNAAMGSYCCTCRREKVISAENREGIVRNGVPIFVVGENKTNTKDKLCQDRKYTFNAGNGVLKEEVDVTRTNKSLSTHFEIVTSKQPKVKTQKQNSKSSLPTQPTRTQSGVLEKDKQTILKNFKYLKDELDMDSEVLDYFIAEEIFTQDQVDLINAECSRRRKVDCFLRMLLRSKNKAYEKFLEILTRTKNDHIRQSLEKETNASDIVSDTPNMTTLTTHALLKKYKKTIINELEPEMVLDHFIQAEEFTIDEYEAIISEKTRKSKVERFTKILMNDAHLPRGYVIFLNALKISGEDGLHEQFRSCDKKEGELDASPYDVDQFPVCNIPDDDDDSLTDDSDMLLEIKIKIKSKKKSKSILQKLTDYQIQREISDRLFSDTDCLLHSSSEGSIVIRIQGCKKGSIKVLMKNGKKVAVSKILGIVLSHPAVVHLADRKTVEVLEVHMVPSPQHGQQEEKFDPKTIIRRNIAFLTEELDAIKFMDLDIFTDVEKKSINENRLLSRASGTRCMFDLALDKSDEDLDALIDEIKKRKEYVWNRMFVTDDTKNPKDALTSNYEFLLENVCPSGIIVPCCQSNLLRVERFTTGGTRSLITKYILHDIMKKSHLEIKIFFHILSTFQPEMILPVGDVLTEDKVKSKKLEDMSSSIRMKPVTSVKPQEDNRESGYWSLNRTPVIKRKKIVEDNGSRHNAQTTTIGQTDMKDEEGIAGLLN